MTWQKGQSGNPGGRPQDKIVTEALRRQALRIVKSGKGKQAKEIRRLDRMVDVVWKAAEAGKPWACNMIADRLDGRPVQPVEGKQAVTSDEVFLDFMRIRNGLPPLHNYHDVLAPPAEPVEVILAAEEKADER